jgi:hypothetical protein
MFPDFFQSCGFNVLFFRTNDAFHAIASGISYLTNYNGIRRLHQYRNISLVMGL